MLSTYCRYNSEHSFKFYVKLRVTNMATVRNFEVAGEKFQADRICA